VAFDRRQPLFLANQRVDLVGASFHAECHPFKR
jgi:hypothetical protein